MPTDRVTRDPKLLKGSQLADALRDSIGVKHNERDDDGLFTPKPSDTPEAIYDVREWLRKLVLGERVTTSSMSSRISKDRKQDIVNRLRGRDLITVKTGSLGGAVATDRLRELARTSEMSDDDLRALAFADLTDEEQELAAQRKQTEVAAVEQSRAEQRAHEVKPPPPVVKMLPSDPSARRVHLLRAVKAWLSRGAAGEEIRVAHIAKGTNMIYEIAHRARDAGYLQRRGDGVRAVYVVPESMRQHVASLNDEQVAALIWPGSVRLETDQSPETAADAIGDDIVKVDVEGVQADADASAFADVVGVGMTHEQMAAAGDDHLLSLLAERMGQFLLVLERMDKRFARMERELGLKPIEEEESA